MCVCKANKIHFCSLCVCLNQPVCANCLKAKEVFVWPHLVIDGMNHTNGHNGADYLDTLSLKVLFVHKKSDGGSCLRRGKIELGKKG